MIVTQSSITASAFFGDGSHLTGSTDLTKVAKTGDTMTGTLTMTNVSVSLTGALGSVVGQSSVTTSGGLFGAALAVGGSSITTAGALTLTQGAALNLSGAAGNVIGQSSFNGQAALV